MPTVIAVERAVRAGSWWEMDEMHEAVQAAQESVARESDAQIVEPRYTRAALEQMGMRRSYGASKSYRAAFTVAFVDAWCARYKVLTGLEVR